MNNEKNRDSLVAVFCFLNRKTIENLEFEKKFLKFYKKIPKNHAYNITKKPELSKWFLSFNYYKKLLKKVLTKG